MARVAKGTIPSGAALSLVDDAEFERIAVRELMRTPIAAWPRMLALWLFLPRAQQATRARILAECVRLAAAAAAPLPAEIAGRVAAELTARRGASRNRIKAPDKIRAAARYVADNPQASLREIAKAVGVGKDTVAAYRLRGEFDLWLKDFRALAALEKHRDADQPVEQN